MVMKPNSRFEVGKKSIHTQILIFIGMIIEKRWKTYEIYLYEKPLKPSQMEMTVPSKTCI
jgi:hypothetical protein